MSYSCGKIQSWWTRGCILAPKCHKNGKQRKMDGITKDCRHLFSRLVRLNTDKKKNGNIFFNLARSWAALPWGESGSLTFALIFHALTSMPTPTPPWCTPVVAIKGPAHLTGTLGVTNGIKNQAKGSSPIFVHKIIILITKGCMQMQDGPHESTPNDIGGVTAVLAPSAMPLNQRSLPRPQ